MANETKRRSYKRIASMMLAAVMTATTAFTAVPMTAGAEYSYIEDYDISTASAEWDGSIATNFAGGAGTEANPFLVADGAQLALIMNEVKNSTTFEGVYFKLTQDILLNDDIGSNPNVWTPIGSSTRLFQGTFDGDGHKVIGLYCEQTESGVGLFGRIGNKATIKNVTTSGGALTATDYDSGNICGNNAGGLISNCTNTNPVTINTSRDAHGGICGYNTGRIENCKNSGNITITYGAYYVGGISGRSVDDSSAVYNCTNTGKIIASGNVAEAVAGICGGSSNTTISKCVNKGMVRANYQVGGICGSKTNGSISDCSNTATITVSYRRAGGISGHTNNVTVSNCYNTGKITVTGDNVAGGIVGFMDYSTISSCYNTADVDGGDYYMAGIAGWMDEGTIENCYNTGDIEGSVDYQGGVAGMVKYGGTIRNSYNTGDVTGGGKYIGGIAGAIETTTNVSNCFNSGDISGQGNYVAGIAPHMNRVTMDACYNTGDISGASYVGGLWAESASADYNIMTECYTTGEVTGTGTNIYPVGETIGTIENVYYDSDLCTASYYSNASFAKSTTELTAASAIEDLGFNEDTWSKTTNTTWYLYYPDLASIDGDAPRFVKGAPTPEGLKATPGNGQVTLKWNAVDGATKYAVYYYYNNEYVLVNSNVTAANYTVTGLKNNVKYGFKVKAYAADMWSATSDMVYATPTKPNIVPQNVTVTAGDTKATVKWSAVSGATKYAVYLYKDGAYTTLKNNITGTSYTVTGLENGVKVGFKVKAYVGEWSAASELVYVTPVPANIVPQNLTTTVANGKVRVNWDKISGATKYAVYQYVDGKYTCLDSSITTNTYLVTGLSNGTKYGFKVKAYVGKWSAASEMVYATPVGNIIPQNIKTVCANGKIRVNWDKVSGATKYAVYIYEDGKYTCLASNITTNTYLVTGLSNGTKYGFKVKAYVGKWSGASAMAYGIPVANSGVPQNVKATAGNAQAKITWSAVPGADRYAVYIYKDGKYTCLNSNITGTSYTATGLTNGTQVGFKVKAYINGAWSAASAMAEVTPNA